MKDKTVYQDAPCAKETIRKLEVTPAPSVEEQALAQERINRLNEVSRQRAMAADTERMQQEKNDIEQEKIELEKRKLELQEKQAVLDEQLEQPTTRYIYLNPQHRPHWHRPHQHTDWHQSTKSNTTTPGIKDRSSANNR